MKPAGRNRERLEYLEQLEKPESPGVYVMRNQADSVLYVGKALNLRTRTMQYLHITDSRAFIPRMLRELHSIEYIVTSNEKEALLLESQLIKKLHPKYNVRLRDDRNFLLVRVDGRHPYPRLEFVRRRKKDGADYFGPYPSAAAIREFVRFLSRAYRLRTCRDGAFAQRVRPCVMFGMGWCSAPCVAGTEPNSDYGQRLTEAKQTLRQRSAAAEQLIEKRMETASEALRFEEAARYRDLLKSLRSLWTKPLVRMDGVESADVFGVYQGPLGGVLYALSVREGAVTGTQSYFDETLCSSNIIDLASLLFQYYTNHETVQSAIIPHMENGTVHALQDALAELGSTAVRLETPRIGRKRALVAMAEQNARQVYDNVSRGLESGQALMAEVSEALGIPEPVEIVECVDISSFQGGDAVGSLAVARQGKPQPKDYRCFHIKGDSRDDFGMMVEVVTRHMRSVAGSTEVRLLVLDGGPPQLRQVEALGTEVLGHVYLCALAKARPEQGNEHDRLFVSSLEPCLDLHPKSRVMMFLMHLRDEAHRFGVAFHRKKRERRTMSSPLLDIPGVGRKRRMDLIRHFGSLQGVKDASFARLQAVRGLPLNTACSIYNFFHPEDPVDIERS